jgi:hypothetical protein
MISEAKDEWVVIHGDDELNENGIPTWVTTSLVHLKQPHTVYCTAVALMLSKTQISEGKPLWRRAEAEILLAATDDNQRIIMRDNHVYVPMLWLAQYAFESGAISEDAWKLAELLNDKLLNHALNSVEPR